MSVEKKQPTAEPIEKLTAETNAQTLEEPFTADNSSKPKTLNSTEKNCCDLRIKKK